MIRINIFVAAVFLLAATHAAAQDDPCSKKWAYPDNAIKHHTADSTWKNCGEPEVRMVAVYQQKDLVWRRCSEGQAWSAGTCKGGASLFTYEQALKRAESQAGWRMPDQLELSSLHRGTKDTPAIDLAAFPSTPGFAYWSSTPAGPEGYACGYDFRDGGVEVCTIRSKKFHVRLVRQ